jgi:hypothetical protein
VRLSRDDAASIKQVVAEGAGQEMMATSETAERDASGNLVLSDVGLWMASATKKHFKAKELVRLPHLPGGLHHIVLAKGGMIQRVQRVQG